MFIDVETAGDDMENSIASAIFLMKHILFCPCRIV